jgi:hypothetical protein
MCTGYALLSERGTLIMEFNKDKVDDYTLALLFLVMHDENEYGARAWKKQNPLY